MNIYSIGNKLLNKKDALGYLKYREWIHLYTNDTSVDIEVPNEKGNCVTHIDNQKRNIFLY